VQNLRWALYENFLADDILAGYAGRFANVDRTELPGAPGGEATVLVVALVISTAVVGVLGWEKGKRER
jgi:hypothetical protein